MNSGVLGQPVVEQLRPENDDYFILKPKHSGFYSTTLDTLLEYLAAEAVVLCGVASNICVLFPANDAYMRDLELFVPRDCVAANEVKENEHALRQMAHVLKADVSPSVALDLEKITAVRGWSRAPDRSAPHQPHTSL
jgi:nicotinamidase-related amidase